ncbi:MAG: hypothetical protein OXL97_10810 [Chloroflexota bacterium]|nr:hypothetical protein [Chloroflexota bacterium]MDE2885918.1 hypothetical protein [Chloroflexota bacterium]
MIRPFRMIDAPCLLLQGCPSSRDLVHARPSLGHGSRKLTRTTAACVGISAGIRRKVLGSFEDGSLEALVIVQVRRAASAWEVCGFFSSAQAYNQVDELLLAAAAAAGEAGAERLFLRCATEGPASAPAQRAGFHRAFSEELFTGTLRTTRDTPMHFRSIRNRDMHDVFRLHMATAPFAARPALGLTINEWMAAREPSPGRTREYVCDTEHGVSAWARVDLVSDSVIVEAALHPDFPTLAPMLVEGVARVAGHASPVRWIVPTYQPYIAQALTNLGWRSESMYEVSVKPIAQRVRQPYMTPVQA